MDIQSYALVDERVLLLLVALAVEGQLSSVSELFSMLGMLYFVLHTVFCVQRTLQAVSFKFYDNGYADTDFIYGVLQ
jgi:hypothetical protein